MHPVMETIIRTVLSFVLIMIITRILGKHTITQMTYHDFVSAITLGSITANIAFNTSLKSWNLTVALLLFSSIAFLITLLTLKSRKLRKVLSGKPTIVIEDGKILEKNLRKLRFSLDTLNQELREKDIFDIGEVEFAVLELNGQVSVLRKPEYRQLTRRDLALASGQRTKFPIELIMDGRVVEENIHQEGLSPEWLDRELEKRDLDVDKVCYAVKGTNGSLYFDLYDDRLKHPIDGMH
ncbi:DUF421 domain-containing protein [Paenibacillus sp. J5C_2022]|uniref:DUF421 domain-containing protein n=1 Tax=Paenibacillus sp. J5C2022 TaxID=2977129 RepID=UPI0021CE00F3|nr:DUF421 domain-containing protein [Paenibacillus sp. J5C2022]MCU6710530.1 DUF421 domain-containing protein [Paenibacillus sp. J5C2022]